MLLNILVDELEFNYPLARLRAAVEKVVNCLRQKCTELAYKPNHFLARFDSELMDQAANIHLHADNADLADIIVNKFQKVDQSGMQRHGKESLTTQSFLLDITAMQLKDNPTATTTSKTAEIGKKKKKKQHFGAGKRRLRGKFHNNVNLDAIHVLDNKDNYCLFSSFEILRNWETMEASRFYKYVNNPKRIHMDVLRLLTICGIPKQRRSYSIEEFGPKICEYYQRIHGNQFRLFAFLEVGEFRPFWASKEFEYQKELAVLFMEGENGKNGHYVPVFYPGKLFGADKKYCYAVND
jgi:hypothetical protein